MTSFPRISFLSSLNKSSSCLFLVFLTLTSKIGKLTPRSTASYPSADHSYSNYDASSPQIQWFWRAVRSFNKEERAKLLQFATGTSKVPLNGFKELEGMQGILDPKLRLTEKEPQNSQLSETLVIRVGFLKVTPVSIKLIYRSTNRTSS